MISKILYCIIPIAIDAIYCKSPLIIEEFTLDDENIIVENFDSINTSKNRFNDNNVIYKVGRKFTFTYYCMGKIVKVFDDKNQSGKKDTYDWKFEKFDNNDTNSVNKLIMDVNAGLAPFIQIMPGCNQTVITSIYKMLSGEVLNNEMIGVIENKKNIWMHPLRSDSFKLL